MSTVWSRKGIAIKAQEGAVAGTHVLPGFALSPICASLNLGKTMSKQGRHKAKPYLVLAISVFFTVIAAGYTFRHSAEQGRLSFGQIADAQQAKISQTLDYRIALLRGMAGLFAASNGVTREEFRTYASRAQMDTAYPDIRAVGYGVRMKGVHTDYFPITYLESINKPDYGELGLDMSTDPVLRPALEQARDSALPAISDRWNRVSDEPVFLICLATYNPAASLETVERRREALVGFAFGVVRPGALVQSTLGPGTAPPISVRVFNGNEMDPSHLLYSTSTLSQAETRFAAQRTIHLPGATWTVMFMAQPSFPAGAGRLWLVLLLSGGFVSFVLFFVMRSEVIAHVTAVDRAEQLRKSKGIQQQLNIQLEQHRTKLKELISQMPGVVWEMHGRPDAVLEMTFISDYVEKMLGYSAGEWIETPNLWLTVIHPEDRDRVFREITQVFQTGAGGSKFRWIAKDGRVVWVETHEAVVLDGRGEPDGIRGVTMDITARHRAEETLRDKEVRLQIALTAARMASWHWDLITGNLMWDDAPYTWADFVKQVHPEDQPSVRNAVDQALQERHDLDFEFRVVQADSIRWLTLKAKVFQGQDGRPAYISGVSLDVTDRRNAAEALRASEERYRLAARATNDAIWDWDLTTGLVQWNEGIRTLFGYTAEQVGTDIAWRFDQIHPGDRERVISGFNAVIDRGGRFWSDEYQFRCANGSYATVTDRAYIEQDESGKAVRLIAAMADVTRLKQAEREREQLLRLEHTARKQAESANRMKDEFIATLSHELRTPITPILGWTQLLRNRAPDGASLQRGLNVIEQNARSQAKLIEDLLDVSRIVTGKMRLKIQTVQVQPIIQAAIDAVQHAADAKNVRIEIKTDRAPLQIAADPDRLQQVVWNLLSNAIKFTPRGGTISISAEQAGDEMRIVVRDTGEGIDPEFLPHVFDRFSQADGTNVRTHGGLGVGLSIVRYVVELHGGNVIVESLGKGHGATFTVILPAKAAETTARKRKSKQIARAVSSLNGLQLLVVDDEPDARELLALVLQQEGAFVTTAGSAQEALQVLQTSSPDVLISDIAMPGVSGYVLLGKLREMERQQKRHHVPAIALTAYAREEDRKQALEAGFEMHLSKPIESEKLIDAILFVAAKYLGKAG